MQEPKMMLDDRITLPSAPTVILEIQSLLASESTTVDEVAVKLGEDPAILAQILRVVNSAYYGLSREVTSLRFAVALLGFKEIQRLTLSLAVVNSMDLGVSKHLHRYWVHSSHISLIMKHLVRTHYPLLDVEQVWIAGCLHDIGKLLYFKFCPELVEKIAEDAEATGMLYSDIEKRESIYAASQVGARLCEEWNLPSCVVYAAETHTIDTLASCDATGGNRDIRALVTIGNLLSEITLRPMNEETEAKVFGFIKSELEIDEDELLLLLSTVKELKMEAESFALQVAR
ncbi:MAG: HDOD domain-containing protein [Gemmatimonadetes bacterium]|nr:HDOD domain-containing protein [Gemmatimonadota bacterium]